MEGKMFLFFLSLTLPLLGWPDHSCYTPSAGVSRCLPNVLAVTETLWAVPKAFYFSRFLKPDIMKAWENDINIITWSPETLVSCKHLSPSRIGYLRKKTVRDTEKQPCKKEANRVQTENNFWKYFKSSLLKNNIQTHWESESVVA